jgi:hypothetical protein
MIFKKNISVSLVAFTFIVVLVRLIPHIPNVTPVTAIALCLSAYFGMRYSLVVVLVSMIISDSIIGFYAWSMMLSVYCSFLLAGVLGVYLQKHRTVVSVFVTTISASFLFFVVTNWAVWQFGTMYAHTWSGLIEAYFMAIPFFKNSLVGDLIYTATFFGLFELLWSVRVRWSTKDFGSFFAKIIPSDSMVALVSSRDKH